jgi:hypothetical protein
MVLSHFQVLMHACTHRFMNHEAVVYRSSIHAYSDVAGPLVLGHLESRAPSSPPDLMTGGRFAVHHSGRAHARRMHARHLPPIITSRRGRRPAGRCGMHGSRCRSTRLPSERDRRGPIGDTVMIDRIRVHRSSGLQR